MASQPGSPLTARVAAEINSGPLPPDAAVRRINDREAAEMAKAAAKAADGRRVQESG